MLGEFRKKTTFQHTIPKETNFGQHSSDFSFVIKLVYKCPSALRLYLKLEYLKDVGYTIYFSEFNYTQLKCTTSSRNYKHSCTNIRSIRSKLTICTTD